MNNILSPRDSAKHIAKEAGSIIILEQGIKEIARTVVKRLQKGTLSMSRFSQFELHPKVADEKAIHWLLVVDSLNFCFWSSTEEKWTVTWRGKSYTGYYALCAAINRAMDEGYAITNPSYYSKISTEDVKRIFRGNDKLAEIPLLSERVKILREVGQILLEEFDGSFINCINACSNSAVKLLHIIVDHFPSYKDEGVFESVRVSFYKRAQILIGDIWACFKGKGYGYFKDIEKITMFADYRVPQVLVHFNSMKYSDLLMQHLRKGEILMCGSREEMEIRGCSIHVVELVMEEIKTLLPNIKENFEHDANTEIICNPILIDHFLWEYRREHAAELEYIPFHKTLSIYY